MGLESNRGFKNLEKELELRVSENVSFFDLSFDCELMGSLGVRGRSELYSPLTC